MLDAGWQHATACRALKLTPQEQAAFAAPAQPAEGARMSMDAGDRWVDVLQRLQLPDLVVFGNLLSDSECEALMDAAHNGHHEMVICLIEHRADVHVHNSRGDGLLHAADGGV